MKDPLKEPTICPGTRTRNAWSHPWHPPPLAGQSPVIHWILDLLSSYPLANHSPGPAHWHSVLLVILFVAGAEVWERDWSKGIIRILFLKYKPKCVNVFIPFPPDKVQEFSTCADLASNYLYRLISSCYSLSYSSLQKHSTSFPPTHSPPPLALRTC